MNVLAQLSPVDSEGNYAPPSVGEFFPPVLFEGTPLAMSRINMAQILVTVLLCVFFVAATRNPRLVPGRLQNAGEIAVNFVRNQVIDEVIGQEGRRFLPYFAALFFFILGLNLTGVVPGINIAGSSVVAVPLILALVTYVLFNYQGIKANGLGGYLKSNLFPPGVPAPIYLLVTPIEFVSTFILRPVTLTIRLLANMMAGHLILVLFFGATSYLLFEASPALKAFSLVSFAAGFAFTLFELLVAFLQAYIFALLSAVYLAGAMSHEH